MKTLAEALDKFTLIKGGAGDGERTACETSLLNWVSNGDEWGDALSCAHPIIRSQMISHNDDAGTTSEQMIEAVRLGMDGAIDTWWVPTDVVIFHLSTPRDVAMTRHEKLVTLLTGIAGWKANKQRVDLGGANLRGAYLGGAYLGGAYLGGAYLGDANLGGARNLEQAYNLDTTVGEPASLPDGWEYKNGLIVKKGS